MKIDRDRVATNVVSWVILGLIALGGWRSIDNSINKVDEHEARIEELESFVSAQHNQSIMPVEKPSFIKRTWNWITFKEFRQ